MAHLSHPKAYKVLRKRALDLSAAKSVNTFILKRSKFIRVGKFVECFKHIQEDKETRRNPSLKAFTIQFSLSGSLD